MMWSEQRGGELYIFHNGKPIYKRWAGPGKKKRQPSLILNKTWPNEWVA